MYDRGICLPTVTLWLLFIYVEASVRLKELKSLPFTLDLCRPFAAHCIGYPVVTLGFGVKTYVSYRLRWRILDHSINTTQNDSSFIKLTPNAAHSFHIFQRKQREVAKENEIYAQLLREALPVEQQHRDPEILHLTVSDITSGLTSEDVISSDLTRCPSVSSALYNASASFATTAVASPCTSPFFANFFSSSFASGQQQQQNTGNNSSNNGSNNVATSSRLTKNHQNLNNFSGNNINQFATNNNHNGGFTTVSECHNNAFNGGHHTNSNHNFYGGKNFAATLHNTTALKSNENGSLLSHRKRSNSLTFRQQSDQLSSRSAPTGTGRQFSSASSDDNQSSPLLSGLPIVGWLFAILYRLISAIGGQSDSGATDASVVLSNVEASYDMPSTTCGGAPPASSFYLPSLSWSTSCDSVAMEAEALAAAGAPAHDSDDESSISKESSESNVVVTVAMQAASLPPRTQRKSMAQKHRKRSGINFTSIAHDGNVSQQQNKVQEKDLHAHLESDLEKLRNELRQTKSREQELRRQVNDLSNTDKASRSELQQTKQQYELLQTKFQNLMKARQQDKENVSTLEKRVCEEQKLKNLLEQQLKTEKKLQQKKLEEAVSQAASKSITANVNAAKNECTETCKQRRREMENQVKLIRRDLQLREEQISQLEQEVAVLRQYKESNNVEVMMTALNALQEKKQHLELSLSAETRIKLDLFSALGDAKRQLEITTAQKKAKEQELEEMCMRLNQLTSANNALLFNGQQPANSQQQQQLTPPASVTPVVNMDHQPAYDVLSQQLYTSPYNMNTTNGFMFEDCGMTYHPYMSMNGGGNVNSASSASTPDQQIRYSPPRNSAAK
uniref:Macoilin n=1 Tax=Romanomermis culicivorax TaxID=13658 RepID=A0A915KHE5_ROMCU